MEKFTAYDAYNIIKNKNFSNPQSVIEFIIDDIKTQALYDYKRTKVQFRESLRNGERVYLFANRFVVKDPNEVIQYFEQNEFIVTNTSLSAIDSEIMEFTISWNIDIHARNLVSIDKLASQSLALAGTMNNVLITPLMLQKIVFMVVRKALQQNLLDYDSKQLIINQEKFLLTYYGPRNEQLKDRFALYSGNPIFQIIPENKKLSKFDYIIMETISEIQNDVFPVIEQLRKEAFFQNNIEQIPNGRFPNPTRCIAYTEDAIKNPRIPE